MQNILVVSQDDKKREWLAKSLGPHEFTMRILNDDHLCSDEILQNVSEGKVDLVILDSDLKTVDGFETLDQLQQDQRTQKTPIVMIVCAEMDSQMALALNRGATDCLAYPSSTMVVHARVARVWKRYSSNNNDTANQSGRMLAFVGAKGGVGTTTVAVNTAISLVEEGRQVTLADLRGFYGTMAYHLGVHEGDHPHNLAELLDVPSDQITAQSVDRLLAHHASGIKVLFGAQGGDGYHRIVASQAEALVTSLRNHADFTIFDLPAWPTEAVETVLRKCDQVLVVLEREPASLYAANVLIDTIVQNGVVYGDIVAVVVNRSVLASPIPLDYIRENLRCPIVAMIPPAPDACAAAARSREPLIQFRHDVDCSEALKKLANNLMEEHIPVLNF